MVKMSRNIFLYSNKLNKIYILYIFSKAKAAKRLANKEKAMEEKARQEDNLSQSKELLEISDEIATVKIFFISSTCKKL